jgi:hypothetical protein
MARAKNKKGKKKYKLRNWSTYNEGLKQRGSIDIWISDNMNLEDIWYAKPSGTRGGQPVYSDEAVTITLQCGKVFHQRLRQTEGFVGSIFKLLGLKLDVPDFSTLSRRGDGLEVSLKKKDDKKKVRIIVDGSGLKIAGEGEWKMRKHGKSKRRKWKKIHIAIDEDGEIRAVQTTGNDVSDDDAVESTLLEETAHIVAFTGDGAFDKRKVYNYCKGRNTKEIMIPPRIDAKIWQHGNSKSPPHPRDENLRQIRKVGRKAWKISCGYHIRSLSETTYSRFKRIFGDHVEAKNDAQQTTENRIKSRILNIMRECAWPDTQTIVVG